MTSDLTRIGQAIRAVLDDLYLLPVAYGRSDVVSKTRGWCHQGTHDEAKAFIDARCAEAAVRAMVPAELVALSGKATGGTWSWEGTMEHPAPGEHWWDSPTIYAGRADPMGEFNGVPVYGHGLNLFGRLDPDRNGQANLDFLVAVVNWLRSLIPATTSETQP